MSIDPTMKERMNLPLAELLDQRFESVSIYTDDMSYPGTWVVLFDVNPNTEEGWEAIRCIEKFVSCYSWGAVELSVENSKRYDGSSIGRLTHYTYGRGRVGLGWRLRLPPEHVEDLATFLSLLDDERQLQDARTQLDQRVLAERESDPFGLPADPALRETVPF